MDLMMDLLDLDLRAAETACQTDLPADGVDGGWMGTAQ
jgi:hypothetical protein